MPASDKTYYAICACSDTEGQSKSVLQPEEEYNLLSLLRLQRQKHTWLTWIVTENTTSLKGQNSKMFILKCKANPSTNIALETNL